jgi:hypothetical protein
MFWIEISWRLVLLSLRNEEVSSLLLILLLEIEDAWGSFVVKIELLVLPLRIVVEIWMGRELPVICECAISEFLGE